MVNFPTVITISRILIILPFILVAQKNPFIGAVLFSFASITDFLDGYVARRTGQVTKAGILLDPIADKLLVISALILFVDMEIIPSWIAIIIIVREFIVTGLRIVALSKDLVIPAEMGGKLKVGAQITSVIMLFVDRSIKSHDLQNMIPGITIDFLRDTGIIFLWIAMVLGIISGVQYFISFWKRI